MLIQTSDVFDEWLANLRDERARARIVDRIERAQGGNLGKCEPVGNGVSEMKLDFGPGYRLYFIVEGRTLVVLLCGGDKSTQKKDIRIAHQLAQDWKNR